MLLATASQVFSQKKWTVKEVPNPKEQPSWNYISDPDDILESGTKEEINSLLRNLEETTTDQAAVVLLNSIGKENPRDFAMSLLRKWGVGQKDKNNGVLMLLVMDQRRMEFEVGYGLEGELTDLVCKQIQEEHMVPFAKQGNFDKAVLNGVQQVCFILTGQAPAMEPGNDVDPQSFYSDEVRPALPQVQEEPVNYSNRPRARSLGGVIDRIDNRLGFGGIVIVLFLFLLVVMRFKGIFKKRDQEDFYTRTHSTEVRIIQFIFCDLLLVCLFIFSGITINIFTGILFMYIFTII